MPYRPICFLIALTCLFSVGCASRRSFYENGFEAGYTECETVSNEIQKLIAAQIPALKNQNEELKRELALKNEVLKKFNQIDEEGNLYR